MQFNRFFKSIVCTFLIIFFSTSTNAQEGAIGIGTTSPHPSSILEISSGDKGVIFPIHDKESVTNPAMGLMVYDWDDMGYYFYDGVKWRAFSTAADSLWNINGENIYSIPSKKIAIGASATESDSKVFIQPDTASISGLYIKNPNNGAIAGLRIKSAKEGGLGLWVEAQSSIGGATAGFLYSNAEQGTGVHGYATDDSTPYINKGGWFESEGPIGIGVHGQATNYIGMNSYGGLFESEAYEGIGVSGLANNTSGTGNIGGLFESYGTSGIGAKAIAYGEDGIGLHVIADNLESTNQIGALIEANDDNAKGIKAVTTGINAVSINAEATGFEGVGLLANSTGHEGVSIRSTAYGEQSTAGFFHGIGNEAKAIEAVSNGDNTNTISAVTGGTSSHSIHAINYGENSSAVYGGSFNENSGTGGFFISESGTGVRAESQFTGSGVTHGGWFKANSSSGFGVYSLSAGTSGTAVYGNATSTGGGGNRGGSFLAQADQGIGVYGQATKTGTAWNYGGKFEALGDYAHGVYAEVSGTQAKGISALAEGIDGIGIQSEATGTNSVGIEVETPGTNAVGIEVTADGLSGTAIKAISNGELGKSIVSEMNNVGNNVTYAGHFSNSGAVGRAVYGLASSSTGTVNYGGFFQAQGIAGRAVYGYASHASGANYAGYFRSNSLAGTGIFAEGDKYAGLFEGNVEMHTTDGSTVNLAMLEGAGFGFEFQYDGVTDDLELWSKKFSGNEAPRMTWKKNGRVGIGTEDPDEILDVVGNVNVSGSVFASCGTLSCSDERYKTNIRTIANALELVSDLDGVYYDWKIDEFPERNFSEQQQVGVIAQQLEKIFPQLVHTDKSGYKSVAYDKLAPVLIEAIKELNSQLTTSESKYEQLENRMTKLENIFLADDED